MGSCAASSATDQRSFFSRVAVIVQFWNSSHGAALDEEDLPVTSQSSMASVATSGEMLAGSQVSKTDASRGATT